jgi:hypothetical protein
MRYELKPPIYFVGQTVFFVDKATRKRIEQHGTIRQVKTNYFLQDRGKVVKGGHVYLIKADGKEIWVSENNILRVILYGW